MRNRLRGGTVRAVHIFGRLTSRVRAMDARDVDAAVAAVLAILAMTRDVTAANHHSVLTLLLAGAICATVAWRRRAPIIASAVAVAGIGVYEHIGGDTHLTVEPIAVLLNYYTLGRSSSEADRIGAELLLLAAAVGAISISPTISSPGDVLGTWLLFVMVPFAGGRAIGSRGALTRELRASAERMQQEQDDRARRAAAEERTRIARELHDVVAHSVSVMVIQTAAARRVAASDREAARDALRSVESCGRDALIEMRRMVGVLRRGDAELAGVAAPGLSQLEELTARARVSGLPVELRIEGERTPLPAGVDLVAFRVIQEALTNSIKHAGPARATVLVRFGDAALELDVSDTGRGPAPAGELDERVGHGLVGMRERLTLYGGELTTGRRRGGGFRVNARIPLQQAVLA